MQAWTVGVRAGAPAGERRHAPVAVRTAGRDLQVSVIENSGDLTGTEVPQVYLGRGTTAGTPPSSSPASTG